MTQKIKILQSIQKVATEVFETEHVFTDETTAKDVENWDSLGNIRFYVSLEEEFNVRFSANEMSEIPNIGALISCIENKLAS